MRVRVTASNDAGSASALSEPTAAVALRPPVNTAPPAITGEARQGATLTSLAGTWTGSPPILLLRRWERCTSGALTCTGIDGAVGEKYTLGLADVLTHVRVVITADNGEVASAASALVGPIAAASTAGGGTTPPPPPPPPPAQPAALSATITAPAKAKLAKALAGKLSVLADCTAACKVTSRLELARKDARKLKLPAVIATGHGHALDGRPGHRPPDVHGEGAQAAAQGAQADRDADHAGARRRGRRALAAAGEAHARALNRRRGEALSKAVSR